MDMLRPSQYKIVCDLFQPLYFHLCVPALLERGEPGFVWVDDPLQPRSALARCGQRFFLCGQEDNPAFIQDLRDLFDTTFYPQALANQEVEFSLFLSSQLWETKIGDILADKAPIRLLRQYYARNLHDNPPTPGWRETIPTGFWVQQIDHRFLAEKQLENFDDLYAEITSEAPSVGSFLSNRFGFCLRSAESIAGWCMSEYNSPSSCEIGIETAEPYQKQGVARITASALIEHASSVGISEIGWDCWADNTASVRTALALGLQKVRDYPVFLAWFDRIANLAVNGNVCFNAGKPQEALAWFAQAFSTGKSPLWAYVVAAFAHNQLGNASAAIECLRSALQAGFEDRDWINSSSHLANLHNTPEWQALMGANAGLS
jgi:RimJ/RimL family protein N-acetyltransferase